MLRSQESLIITSAAISFRFDVSWSSVGSLTVFDVTKKIADKAAVSVREQRAKGVTIDLPDAIIAATCMVHKLTLVTYNKKHYLFANLAFYPLPNLP